MGPIVHGPDLLAILSGLGGGVGLFLLSLELLTAVVTLLA